MSLTFFNNMVSDSILTKNIWCLQNPPNLGWLSSLIFYGPFSRSSYQHALTKYPEMKEVAQHLEVTAPESRPKSWELRNSQTVILQRDDRCTILYMYILTPQLLCCILWMHATRGWYIHIYYLEAGLFWCFFCIVKWIIIRIPNDYDDFYHIYNL